MIRLIVGAIPVGIAFFFWGYFFHKVKAHRQLASAEEKAKEIIQEAKREAENLRKDAELTAREELYKLRSQFENEVRSKREELESREAKIIKREENLERRAELLEIRERDLDRRQEELENQKDLLQKRSEELQELLEEEKKTLVRISGMDVDEARKILMERLEKDLREEAALMAKKIEEEARENAEKKAREIIGLAIQRCATDQVVESTVTVVSLPSEEMKGRIIGREGRNIRAFEMATGVNVIIDDTPEVVTLSSFDPLRREIARISLERLVVDGRIHPARIEEVVNRVKEEIYEIIKEEGEKVAFEVGVHDLHPQALELLGKLKFRTSYGQNVLQHSKEVAMVMGIMASELGLDSKLAKRIGLIHDLGKALDHEVEGSHDIIGADLALKLGEPDEIVQAIRCHHEAEPCTNIYGVLLQAADTISAARPGARRETLENYVKRLEKLENIANSFPGVEKAYAIQAGREVRVMVQPDKLKDEEIHLLARDITKKIEKEMEFAGQIKVTIIRETRAVEYTR